MSAAASFMKLVKKVMSHCFIHFKQESLRFMLVEVQSENMNPNELTFNRSGPLALC